MASYIQKAAKNIYIIKNNIITISSVSLSSLKKLPL